MNRTKPIGVRFDPEKLEFIKGREKLESNQQVVDLLVNRYWWEHKIPVVTHKEAPPLHLKEQVTQIPNPGSIFQPAVPKVAQDAIMRKYVEDRQECTSKEEYMDWVKRLEADTRISDNQKQLVKNTH